MALVPLAAAERMLNGGATLVGCIAARFDVGDALRVKAQSAEWKIASGRKGKTWWWSLAAATPPAATVDAGWRAIRVAAAAASDGDYADALEMARALRDAAPTPEARVRFDFAFPGEPDWAKDDLRTLLAGASFSQSVHAALPLLAAVDDEALLADAIGRLAAYQAIVATNYACDVVVALPVDAATRVLGALAARALAARGHDEGALRPLALAMSAIRTEPMARDLARWLRHPRFGRWVTSYFERDHALARVALEPLARGKSIAADCARALLAGNARAAEPDAGTLEDAPPLLASPPWKAREPVPPLALATLPWDDTIAWQPGERERLLETPPSGAPSATVRAITPEELAEFDALPEGQHYVDVWPRWENKRWLILELPEARMLSLWDGGTARLYARPPCWMLARFGERALAGLYARSPFEAFDESFLVAYLRVASPPSARAAARLFARRRSFRKRTRAWLLEHAEVSAIALIPAAFDRETRGTRVARRALQLLGAERPAIVTDVARRYGPAAEERLRALCFCEPLARIDVRGRAPKWLRLESLPPLRTAAGRVLPRAAAATLVDVLRCRGEDVPYAGISVLKDALDPTSLDAFAWALFHAWLLHGAPRTHGWMARALAAFPRDDTALRLQPHVRESAHGEPRACGALVGVLAAIGDDGARLVLQDLEHHARSPIVQELLHEARDAGQDDVALDLDLDARGEATIDLGGRIVRVVLDESLVPRVVLEDGRRLAQMPRAAKNDDPRRVAAATTRFKRLSRVARGVAKTEVVRLQRAMLDSRRFRASDSRASLGAPPARRARRAAHRLGSLRGPGARRDLSRRRRRVVRGRRRWAAVARPRRRRRRPSPARPRRGDARALVDDLRGLRDRPALRAARAHRLLRNAGGGRRRPRERRGRRRPRPLAPRDARRTRLAVRGPPDRGRVARSSRQQSRASSDGDVQSRHRPRHAQERHAIDDDARQAHGQRVADARRDRPPRALRARSDRAHAARLSVRKLGGARLSVPRRSSCSGKPQVSSSPPRPAYALSCAAVSGTFRLA